MSDKPLAGFIVEIFRDPRLGELVRFGVFFELYVVAGNFRRALGQARKIEFDQRQNLRAFVVAENARINFAAFDVFLDQRRRIEFILYVLDPLHHFFHVLDDGAGIDADRSILPRGLHDERERNIVRVLDASAVGGREERSLDAVEGKNLLGDRLVLAHEKRMRTGAGEAQAKQIDVGDHVHFFCVVAVERLG